MLVAYAFVCFIYHWDQHELENFTGGLTRLRSRCCIAWCYYGVGNTVTLMLCPIKPRLIIETMNFTDGQCLYGQDIIQRQIPVCHKRNRCKLRGEHNLTVPPEHGLITSRNLACSIDWYRQGPLGPLSSCQRPGESGDVVTLCLEENVQTIPYGFEVRVSLREGGNREMRSAKTLNWTSWICNGKSVVLHESRVLSLIRNIVALDAPIRHLGVEVRRVPKRGGRVDTVDSSYS